MTGAFASREGDETEQIPGVVVFRFDAPLIYANAGAFAYAGRDLVDAADPPAQVLVVDCEEMFAVDFTGAGALTGLAEDMRERGVEVRLARVHKPVLERLRASGVVELLGEEKIFRRVEDAVTAGS